MKKDQSKTIYRPHDLRQQVAEGLFYAHSRLNANTSKTLEAASFLYALIELLSEKGVITIKELDERKQAVGQRLLERFRKNGKGVILQDQEYNKYTFGQELEIDCESGLLLCRATCYILPIAMTKQVVWQGVVSGDQSQLVAGHKNRVATCETEN